MASDIIAAVTCVAQFTVAPIVKQVKYVLDYQQNMTNLPKEVQKLMDLKLEVEGLVSAARGNAEDIKPSVEAWVKEVDQIAEAARQMIREEEELSKKRCFIGLCPNPVSRHRSSRKAFKKTMHIVEVQKGGGELKEGSVSFPVSAVPSFPVTVTLGKGFLDFNSRSKTWEEIMKALKDPEAGVIGVYGMGGLGKTTLVNQVAARAVEEKMFDEVVVPVVTGKNVLDAKEFQEEMAKVLNMKRDDQWNQWNVSQRADRIFKRLTQKTGDEKTEKKIILILDDLRAKPDLEQVGIPFGAGIKGCKILFTSRFQYISYVAQKKITLGVLEEEEAWRLFRKTAGDVLEDPAFCDIGKGVTKNCKGLPILIVTVAGALLQRRSLGAWKDALINLQQGGSKEMQEFVDSALEFISFNHLPVANKSLFLLCGMLGGGEISIFDQLLKLGIGWGLFKHTKTMEEARNNLETLILDLKASFLLLDGQSVDTVRMHDVVRDVAIKIASNEGHNMLLGSSENWPEDDEFRRCNALTFPYGIVPPLPECLVSPSLKFLLLYHNCSSLKITDNLFEKMQELTVLCIRSVDLSPKLPSSLAFLENLQTLSLDLCKLKDISVVGTLKKLKILSLKSTGIVVLPMELGDLSELRILDLNGCSQLKVIPPGIIQRLSRLEELHMAECFLEWEVEGLASSERRNASLDELNCLVNLTTLRIHIPDTKLLPKDFCFEKLERFTIMIGDKYWDWGCHDEQSLYKLRGVKINFNGRRKIHLEAGMQEMFKRTEILYLDGMENIQELEWKKFQELKFVHIKDSAETRYIVDVMEFFPSGLESLYLINLPHLQNVCTNMFMTESSFINLKHVDVYRCNSLRNLFCFSMARGLVHLEEFKVTDCDSLEAIVEDTREEDKNGDVVMDKLEFRQLRSLIFECLPKLASFYNSVTNSSMFSNRQKPVTSNDVGSDEMGSDDSCAVVKPFFNGKVSFPKLKKLRLYKCDSMEYLFDQSVVTSLQQLNSMEIDSCTSLKGIVAHAEKEEETNESIKFPQLVDLSLRMLPCLTRFCSECSIVFPTLTQLQIKICEQLKAFVWTDTVGEDKTITNRKLSAAMQTLFNEKVELPNLKTLALAILDNVETIWHTSLHEDSFFKLEQVEISLCPKLLKIFPSTMLRRIQSLEYLELGFNCSVEEVFENDEMTKPNISQGGETTEDDRIIFSQLRRVWISSLSNLKRFCSGSCVVFPALTKLTIRGCKKMETFMYPIGVSNSRRKGVEDMDSNDMQPLFDEKVKFPSLKELQLAGLNNIKILWDSQRIHKDSFSALEQLTIEECANLLRVFPLAMLGRIHKVHVDHCRSLKYVFPASVTQQQLYHLEELKISFCKVETIVCQKQEEEVKEEAVAFVFPRLVTLRLESLPKLESFYPGRHTTQWPSLKELVLQHDLGMFPSDLVEFMGYGGDPLFIEKIGSLTVKDCRGLASIVQVSVSFKFLTELEVCVCGGLVSLLQFSTAKGLVQLKGLTVSGCDAMKEIVASESAEDEIVFSKLNTLILFRLPSLVSFYPGKCALRFPLLEQVRVEWCSNMKAFCGGIATTPKLKTLSLTGKKMNFERHERQDKDLNTIIKEAYSATVDYETRYLKREIDHIRKLRTKAGIVTELEKKSEVSTVIVKQDKRDETCKDVVQCSEEIAETNGKATKSSVEPERSENATQSVKNDEVCEKIVESRKEVHTYDKEMKPNDSEAINSRKEASKVDDEGVELSQEGEFCETIVEPREEIGTCKETVKARTETEGSLALTPDIVDVTCPSSQSLSALGSGIGATTCQKNNDSQGLQVTQQLVPLLEKARDKHGDFNNSPLIKSKTMRIVGMEGVGQVPQEAYRPTTERATSSSKHLSQAEDDICDNRIITDPEKKSEISTIIVKQDRGSETCEDAVECSEKEVYKVDDERAELRKEGVAKARNEAESLLSSILLKKPKGLWLLHLILLMLLALLLKPIMHFGSGIGATTYQRNNDFEGLEVAQHLVPLLETARDKHGDFHSSPPIKSKTVAQRLTAAKATSSLKNHSEPEAQICENSTNPSKDSEIYENSNEPGTKTEIVTEPGKMAEISTARINQDIRAEISEDAEKHNEEEACKANDEGVELRNEGKFCEEIDTCKARNEGSQNNEFQGLHVAQHLVPLLEKARDKHGDFHNSPSIKSKAVRTTAMESVGQVLEILQTQTPRTIDAEKIQFMEDAFHDLSFMSFPIEWLHLLIDEARKWLQRKAKIEEMEAQLLELKREMEMEKALDQPFLDV